MRKGLLLLGTVLLSLALLPVSGRPTKGICEASGLCTPSFCERCVHQGGTCMAGAESCFCVFGSGSESRL